MLSAALLILALTPGVDNGIFRDNFDAGLCPAGRQTRANISYQGFTITNVDVRQWPSIWGRSTAFDSPVPWPGASDSMPSILNFGKDTYIAAQFDVTPNTPISLYGWLTHTEYNYGADLTVSISTECGDFNPPNPKCVVASTSGQLLVPWALPPPASFCPLAQGQSYFLNLEITDPDRFSSTCPAAAPSCVVQTANNFHMP
jgi:hypothetical protein